PLEPAEVASGGDDLPSAQELGGLNREQPDHPARAEHEHTVAPGHLRLPPGRDPAGDPRDAGARRECRIDAVGQSQRELAGPGAATRRRASGLRARADDDAGHVASSSRPAAANAPARCGYSTTRVTRPSCIVTIAA